MILNKLLLTCAIVGIIAIGGWYVVRGTPVSDKDSTMGNVQPTANPKAFSPELEGVLKKKMSLLTQLVSNRVIVDAVIASTSKNKSLSQQGIDALDKKWRDAKGIDSFISPFLTNNVAEVLLGFAEANPGFTELFVADGVGLNVGQTNKTSDYYQADEEWWVKGFNQGRGASYWGEIEYDESAKTEAIPLYVPIVDAQGSTIGVLKAILDINSIKSEL